MSLEQLEQLLVLTCIGGPAADQFRSGDLSHSTLRPYTDAIQKLSMAYTGDGPAPTLSGIDARAYALYYTPINYAKFVTLLTEIPSNFWSQPLTVLDYGCGPGTATLAVLDTTRNIECIVLEDSNAAMLAVARDLIEHRLDSRPIPFKTTLCREVTVSHEKFDLILAGNVLNELADETAQTTVMRLIARLKPGGIMVIIEPALLSSTRRLMAIRDRVLANEPSMTPLYPCTHRNNCPMLQLIPDGWCHTSLRWEEPRLTRFLDQMLGFNKHRIKLSALVLRANISSVPGFRVIEDATSSKIGSTTTICGEGFFGSVTLPKRNTTEGNKGLKKLRMHQRISVSESPPQDNSWTLSANSTVTLL